MLEGVAGDLDMRGVFGNRLAAGGIELLPGLLAADPMQHRHAFALVIVTVGDVVDLPKLLLPAAPGLTPGGGGFGAA